MPAAHFDDEDDAEIVDFRRGAAKPVHVGNERTLQGIPRSQ
jgi:hypothetical protein